MKRKDIGESLMHDNEEYRKLRAGEPDKRAPREPPSRQTADRGGYTYADFEQWTDEELVGLARTLDLPHPETLSRDKLIDKLIKHEVR